MKITIKEIPPSNNEYMGNSKNYNIYRREKERWHWLIKSALCKAEKPQKPLEKALVKINYYFKDGRRRDPDNYSGKMLLDPLVREGVLIDDNFDVVTLQLGKGGVDKNNPRTEIEITEPEAEEMTQCERIVQYCNDFGSITTLQAFTDLGVTRLASRINDLKNQGYVIESRFVNGKNRYGEIVSYKEYKIIS
jgi:Holliday junction resolvase RusA-like endonuclease